MRKTRGNASHTISTYERDAILAGLRLLQKFSGEMYGANPLSQLGGIQEIFTNGGDHPGLDPSEIDSLCERLNV